MTSSGNEAPQAANEDTCQPSLRPLSTSERQQAEDLHWAATAPEVQQHAGRVVVIRKKRVVGVPILLGLEFLVTHQAALSLLPAPQQGAIQIP